MLEAAVVVVAVNSLFVVAPITVNVLKVNCQKCLDKQCRPRSDGLF